MVSTRGKKRKVDEAKEEEDEDTQLEVLEQWWVRGDIWYEDGSVVLLAPGNVGFKVS